MNRIQRKLGRYQGVIYLPLFLLAILLLMTVRHYTAERRHQQSMNEDRERARLATAHRAETTNRNRAGETSIDEAQSPQGANTIPIQRQASAAKHPILPDGIYVGLESMSNLSPEEHPDAKWYHLSTLSLHDDSVTLDKIPVYDIKGKRTYSASDGGFLTYKGRVELGAEAIVLHLKMTESDYVLTDGKNHDWIPKVKVNKEGSLTVDGLVYRLQKKTH